MNQEQLIKQIATQLNRRVNIPFLPESIEQAFFEFIVKSVIELLGNFIQEEITKKAK